MKEKNISILKISVAAVLSFVLCYSQVLYSFDKIVADKLYQVPSTTDNRIKIIAIDERTLQEYGNVSEWSREIPAQLVEMLNEDKENAPAVIGFDIMYVSDGDEAGDARFAQACEQAGNVITAVNVVTKDKLTLQKDGSLASRIRPTLAEGSIVTDTRTNVMYVATEYGCVNLKGLSVWERAEALISIAHPDFRQELVDAAKEQHIWRRR